MKLGFAKFAAMTVVAGSWHVALAAPDTSVSFDKGWRLWLDRDAKWRDDTLFLPDEVDFAKIPVNPPSGGWQALRDDAGIPVSLPDTVEGHQKEPTSGDANAIINSKPSYEGVSWWYRSFTAPVLRPGERVVFSFPGARLRSEVYVNGQLCGYNIITEAAFTADVTKALRPGANQIAVRVTNPGGNLDWIDFLTFQWGKYTLPISHSFGGIDGGVRMEVHAPVSVEDLTVFNTPNPRTVKLQAEVHSTGQAYNGPVSLAVEKNGQTLWSQPVAVQVPAGGKSTVSVTADVPAAQLWDVDRPNLYTATASLQSIPNSGKQTSFGFRWFAPQGVGSNAYLTLNGRRFVPRSSISWGFWAPNGMFPDQAAAEREVAAVRALGLNSIQNHRHMPKPTVLSAFDRAGLLRWCEPGAGLFTFATDQGERAPTQGNIDTSGQGGEATTFTERYERAKVMAMIRENRSHPSVTVWTLQNEISPNLHNPKLWNVLREMKALDPSRTILLKSGINVPNQVWSPPYSEEWKLDNGRGVSGWWDQHTALSSPGVYKDWMYRSPSDFIYRSNNRQEIVTWGEMATSASPDNHVADMNWYQKSGQVGYDYAAHRAALGAYNQFLDEFKFRGAFPTAESLFKSAGNKHYFSAGRLMENARISDANDYIVLSGWESTAIENHSGMVDSLRLLKGDPNLVKRATAPAMLVVRPRQSVVAPGESDVVDVHLVNELNLNGTYQLDVVVKQIASQGNQKEHSLLRASFPVSVTGGNVFAQLLGDGLRFTPSQEGTVSVTAILKRDVSSKPILTRTEKVLVVSPAPTSLPGAIAVVSASDSVEETLRTQFKANVLESTTPTLPLKTLVLAGGPGMPNWASFRDGSLAITNTDDPDLYREQFYGPASEVLTLRGLKPGIAKVELFLAENYFSDPGKRIFDLALNGQTVLRDFDIFKEAGGKGKALVKNFDVPINDGQLRLSIPRTSVDNASIAALRVTDAAGNVYRKVFHEKPYTDRAGAQWLPASVAFDWATQLPDALKRVRDEGTRLVLFTSGRADASTVATLLSQERLLRFDGMVGPPGESWLGAWYFGRKHWLLDGLPSDCVLDWQYQIADGDGVMLHGPNVEGVIGYGRNHDAHLGLGAAVITYGRGKIVLFAMPGLLESFTSKGDQILPVVAKRMVYNALR